MGGLGRDGGDYKVISQWGLLLENGWMDGWMGSGLGVVGVDI